MIVRATVTYGEILLALGADEIPSLEWEKDEWITLNEVDVEPSDLGIECEVCGGVEPEVSETVNSALIGDFIAAIHAGDMATAQALVGRVFEDPSDIAVVDRAIFRSAHTC